MSSSFQVTISTNTSRVKKGVGEENHWIVQKFKSRHRLAEGIL